MIDAVGVDVYITNYECHVQAVWAGAATMDQGTHDSILSLASTQGKCYSSISRPFDFVLLCVCAPAHKMN